MTDCFNALADIVLHLQLECCGVQNYTDWTATPWYGQHNNSVPQSCCKANATQCSGLLSQPELLNTQVRAIVFLRINLQMSITQLYLLCCFFKRVFFLQGCESKLEQMLQDVLSYAMLVILGFAIIKVYQI